MIARIKQEITLWRVIVAIIFITGLYATYLRFFEGFRASTNLSDQIPWGLWVGLGTLCGVGLSAAGFGISAAVYLLGMERYRPILRSAILISVPGIPYRLCGISLRDWLALALLASDRNVEPSFGVVRCVYLHHDVHHGADV